MPPPPSQQGKFKPVKPKPKKKIKAGAATEAVAAEAAAAEPKTTVSFAPSAYSGRGRGGEGRGGGRGGRGRGRVPMPTGKVYFTGGEKKKPPSVSAGSRSTSRSSTGSRSTPGGKGGDGGSSLDRANRDNATTEEVVGQLEVAIGSSKEPHASSGTGKDSILDSMDFEDQEGELVRPAGAAQGSLSLEGFMYDTDSSEEEEARRRKPKTESIISPLELPLKDSNAQPPGPEKPRTRQTRALPDPVTSNPITSASHTQQSPFANLTEGQLSNDWFLVQLPTRLPPLRQKVSQNAAAMNVDDDGEPEPVTSSEEPVSAYSEVVTPPVLPGGFDNALSSAAPGRIGKMVVYKSGRTVLVMEGADGSKVRSPPSLFQLELRKQYLTYSLYNIASLKCCRGSKL